MNLPLKKTLYAVGFAVTLTGCASPGALISMPAVPNDVVDSVRFKVTHSRGFSLEENVVQSPATKIPVGASVVISVPAGTSRGQDESQPGAFRTDGFFNAAEQEIERSLMKNGFQVKDRSKFEAILRDLRDNRRDDAKYLYRTHTDIDPEAQPLVRELEQSLKSKQITPLEYAAGLEEIKTSFRRSASSKNRKEGEQELTDISEVMRAAAASEVQADYVLQIPAFNMNGVRDERINILSYSPVIDFVSRRPEVRSKLAEVQDFPCQSMTASLNAKLIHVKTGNVVWIGNHEVSEYSGTDSPLELELRYIHRVTNEQYVKDFVAQQNLPEIRAIRGDLVSVPAWEYATHLIGPTRVSGSDCTVNQRGNDDRNASRTSLARRVAAELIGTIKVGM